MRQSTLCAVLLPGLVLLSSCGALGITCSNGFRDECPGNGIEEAAKSLEATVLSNRTTSIENMPSTDTASFDGYTQIATRYGVVRGEQVYSRLHLDVDFGAKSVDGQMTDFYTLYRRVNGLITVSDGVITDNRFVADLSGSLTGSAFIEGSPGVATVDGELNGRFMGDTVVGVAGTIDASLTYSDGVYGSLDGKFHAVVSD